MKKPQFLFFVSLALLSYFSLAHAQSTDNINSNLIDNVSDHSDAQIFPYEQVFTITAYYSPIEGQKRYVKGSLQADKKLNGNGTNGADGTPVYPGMIAAPKSILFGTKMKIPGIGTVSVHDRGGAIVSAGQRNERHDRLDIWMGSGDEGLNRALQWGRRNVSVMVYGLDNNITENIDLSALDNNFQRYLDKAEGTYNNTPAQIFRKDFGLGDQDSEVVTIKQKLNQLNYFGSDLTDKFDAKTYQAIIKFQLDYEIIDNDQEFGAGYFGPQTRATLEKAINGLTPNKNKENNFLPSAKADTPDLKAENIQFAGNGLSFTTIDLQPGDSGQAVLELQTELKKLHLFGLEPTSYYGDVTTHAVFKFQQTQGLVEDELSNGAGVFGPITRKALSVLVNNRIAVRRSIAENE